METNPARGHLAALLTIVIWGTTFISTKVLLRAFAPVEILFLRFVLGFLALALMCPRRLKLTDRRQEDAARRALDAVRRALEALETGMTPDAVLTDAEEALDALGELTGRTAKEEIVSRIFSRFCVGK